MGELRLVVVWEFRALRSVGVSFLQSWVRGRFETRRRRERRERSPASFATQPFVCDLEGWAMASCDYAVSVLEPRQSGGRPSVEVGAGLGDTDTARGSDSHVILPDWL